MTTETAASEGIEATARWTAAARAGEHARPDRLIDDPWAEMLAGPEGMAWLAGRPQGSTLPIVVRTRFFDDWMRGVVADGSIRQVVLLAAGLDTRAWRLAWPARTTLFEVDRGPVLDAKAQALDRAWASPACHRRAVPGDLAGDWGQRLVVAGLDPSLPTAWLAEGVLFYLPVEVIGHLLAVATSLSAPGSRLGFDAINRAVLESPYTRAWIEMQASAGAPWIGWLDDPVATLAALGWSASLVQPGEPPANHGRWTLPVPPLSAADLPHTWYVTARRP